MNVVWGQFLFAIFTSILTICQYLSFSFNVFSHHTYWSEKWPLRKLSLSWSSLSTASMMIALFLTWLEGSPGGHCQWMAEWVCEWGLDMYSAVIRHALHSLNFKMTSALLINASCCAYYPSLHTYFSFLEFTALIHLIYNYSPTYSRLHFEYRRIPLGQIYLQLWWNKSNPLLK